jgi:hypothetical protein
MTRSRPGRCPWENYPTHKRNRELQVNGERPLVYGYCAQEKECASCAGTLYKPNLVIDQGRDFRFVECPFCNPEGYRKRVEKFKPLLPVGSGPVYTPLNPPPDPAVARKRRRKKKVQQPPP